MKPTRCNYMRNAVPGTSRIFFDEKFSGNQSGTDAFKLNVSVSKSFRNVVPGTAGNLGTLLTSSGFPPL